MKDKEHKIRRKSTLVARNADGGANGLEVFAATRMVNVFHQIIIRTAIRTLANMSSGIVCKNGNLF